MAEYLWKNFFANSLACIAQTQIPRVQIYYPYPRCKMESRIKGNTGAIYSRLGPLGSESGSIPRSWNNVLWTYVIRNSADHDQSKSRICICQGGLLTGYLPIVHGASSKSRNPFGATAVIHKLSPRARLLIDSLSMPSP